MLDPAALWRMASCDQHQLPYSGNLHVPSTGLVEKNLSNFLLGSIVADKQIRNQSDILGSQHYAWSRSKPSKKSGVCPYTYEHLSDDIVGRAKPSRWQQEVTRMLFFGRKWTSCYSLVSNTLGIASAEALEEVASHSSEHSESTEGGVEPAGSPRPTIRRGEEILIGDFMPWLWMYFRTCLVLVHAKCEYDCDCVWLCIKTTYASGDPSDYHPWHVEQYANRLFTAVQRLLSRASSHFWQQSGPALTTAGGCEAL